MDSLFFFSLSRWRDSFVCGVAVLFCFVAQAQQEFIPTEPLPIEPLPIPTEPSAPITEETLTNENLAEATAEEEVDAMENVATEGEFEVNQEGALVGQARMAATSRNRLDDRAVALRIPAPRGLITDRHGHVLAHNQVAWKVGVRLPIFASDQEKISYFQQKLAQINQTLATDWNVPNEVLLRHYDNRRWLPILLGDPINELQRQMLESAEIENLELRAVYLRAYPEQDLACHSIGYVGRMRPLPTGPLQNGDPLFEEWEGRSGLEQIFDRFLQGDAGRFTYIFGADGQVLHQQIEARAVPGNTVVTTLDKDWQEHAEAVLEENSTRSAAVVVDIYSGEVLVLASNPGFDVNDFVPYISTAKWQQLNEDPRKPLLARAYQELYCPASTFKVVTCVAGLHSGALTGNTYYSCPPSITLGDTTFVNWNKDHEGYLNIKDGLKRSNNVFMYQCVRATGSDVFTEIGQRFGFGSSSGLPLPEQIGVMPTDEWFFQQRSWRRTLGNNFNESIGQGDVLSTPVQVARMMAVIGNGGFLPRLQLVRQIQNSQGRVLQQHAANRGAFLDLTPETIAEIQKGLYAVVNESGGTGRSARVEGLEMAAKTGTGQWTQNRNVAWFAGYVPANRPRYAFAFLYEGRPGEKVAGGRTAGALARQFFTPFVEEINALAEQQQLPQEALLALELREQDTVEQAMYYHSSGEQSTGPVEEFDPVVPDGPPVEEEEGGGIGGFFQRLFD